jgi:hypothetical protein
VPGRVAKTVVDRRDVEAELAGELRFERADLELNDDVPNLRDVEEKQVQEEVIAANVEVNLLSDDGEAGAELEKGVTQRATRAAFSSAGSSG